MGSKQEGLGKEAALCDQKSFCPQKHSGGSKLLPNLFQEQIKLASNELIRESRPRQSTLMGSDSPGRVNFIATPSAQDLLRGDGIDQI